jgi:ribonuclease BN (tRNA processing enzyme)
VLTFISVNYLADLNLPLLTELTEHVCISHLHLNYCSPILKSHIFIVSTRKRRDATSVYTVKIKKLLIEWAMSLLFRSSNLDRFGLIHFKTYWLPRTATDTPEVCTSSNKYRCHPKKMTRTGCWIKVKPIEMHLFSCNRRHTLKRETRFPSDSDLRIVITELKRGERLMRLNIRVRWL